MGPVADDALVPTDIDHDIELPFSMMLCMPPLFSVGHVPFAVGSIVGIFPLPPAVDPPDEPLEEPLEPLEPPDPLLPELLLGFGAPLELPELVPELEVPPLDDAPMPPEPPDEPAPELASPSSDCAEPGPWKPGPDEAPPQPAVTPSARTRIVASEPSSKRCPTWGCMVFPSSFLIVRYSTFSLQLSISLMIDIGSAAGIGDVLQSSRAKA
jgi:hypothetical protein